MPAFSVIVPTLDEVDRIAETVEHARRAFGPDAEILVVDGGSSDGTVDAVRTRATVMTSPRGRGTQLEAGARRAAGDTLVFLHADTRVAADAGSRIAEAVARGVTAGCLRLAFADPGARYRLLAAAIDARTRVFRTATGDQVIFATRERYERSGGIPALPIFEDVVWVRRLRRDGPFRRVEAEAVTSVRRWERHGFLRTVARHLFLRTAHALGSDPERLAARYR
ncbi:MAG: TIGR04283 family arsenosugar biosynthesis glycosyltransferase [Gemmatimonadota bacterium]|nr:TIGR04283 family arsenosugar biosynthesis glycosyltransferase [Gemmatimonadota bacterium]